MSCLGEALEHAAEARPIESALIFEGVHYTYRLLRARAATVAGALAVRGIGAGDRVAVGLTSSPELVAAVLGVLRLGAVLVPINPAASSEEMLYILRDAEVAGAVLEPGHAAAAVPLSAQDVCLMTAADLIHADPGPLQPVEAESPALIVYTSGTTGHPKGAVLSHRALLTNLLTVARAWEWSEEDRLLLTLPCFHLHGLGLGLLTTFLLGASVVLRPRFQLEEVLADLERTRATMFFGVPTIYNRLVTLPAATVASHDLGRVRLWVSGSAPLPVATYERFHELFGYSLMDRYGMTECGFALSTPYAGARRPGVVGVPLPGVEVRLVDGERADHGEIVASAEGEQGEILIKGDNLFSGYWRNPSATASALLHGYLRSGDLAVREADGQMRIVGRSSVDIIKTRGFKVGAVEIENCLQRHPGVEEVAVLGLPDADQGERVVAAIVRRAASNPSEADLLAFARQHLAPHKVPVAVYFVADIPKTGPGKFKKKELARRLATDSPG